MPTLTCSPGDRADMLELAGQVFASWPHGAIPVDQCLSHLLRIGAFQQAGQVLETFQKRYVPSLQT